MEEIEIGEDGCLNETAATEIDTLCLHDALPIACRGEAGHYVSIIVSAAPAPANPSGVDLLLNSQGACQLAHPLSSEEHTSELQSRQYLVCRLLLDTKHTSRSPLSPLPSLLSRAC